MGRTKGHGTHRERSCFITDHASAATASASAAATSAAAAAAAGGFDVPVVRTEPWPRRVRGYVDHTAVVDSKRALMLFEQGHLPVWYFPAEDVRTDLLTPSDKHTKCPVKGTASYWDLQVGDRTVANAVWSYPDPIPGREDIAGSMAFYFQKLDT